MSTIITKNTSESVVLCENQAKTVLTSNTNSTNCDIGVQANCAGDNGSSIKVDEKSILTDLPQPADKQSAISNQVGEISDSTEIKENLPNRELEDATVIKVDLHSAMHGLICGILDKMDVQKSCSGSDILESTNDNSVSLPNIDVKNDSALDQLPISVPQETLILRCDPVTCTTTETKHRSFWRRTKRFARRIFCCGASTSKVERSSIGFLVDQTDSVVENMDISLRSAITQEPESALDLPRPADESLPEIALVIENGSAPAEVTALVDGEFESVHVSSPQESRILECDESDPVAKICKPRSLWRRLFC